MRARQDAEIARLRKKLEKATGHMVEKDLAEEKIKLANEKIRKADERMKEALKMKKAN